MKKLKGLDFEESDAVKILQRPHLSPQKKLDKKKCVEIKA